MSRKMWQKRFAVLKSRLYLYPPPEPLPQTRIFWYATVLVTFLVLLFSTFFIFYLTRAHDTYWTNAEDMGIMDQAIWNTVHGQALHQTVCNILSDTNCGTSNGLMRFAIHVEPILFPISLLYLFWPDPKTLVVLQTLIVACGAFPAFWLARLRLRNEWAGVAIAALYLLYPAQQSAVTEDFHAVTLTASLLLFTLYFMYTRRTGWLFFFAILAMACKEEIALVVICFGLWSLLFQRRWRSGLLLTTLATIWAIFALIILPHIFSPIGHPMLASRYSDLGATPQQTAQTLLQHPIEVFKNYVLDPERLSYLAALVRPAGFLPLLTPWILLPMLPTLAINLLSSDDFMHTGPFLSHYSAELVPMLIFATIEAMVLILWLTQRLTSRPTRIAGWRVAKTLQKRGHLSPKKAYYALFIVLIAYTLFSVMSSDATLGHMPLTKGFRWPDPNSHTALGNHLIAILPPEASISAQSKLVSHLSHRQYIYLFPYGDGITTEDAADFVFLDMQSNDIFPYTSEDAMLDEVNKVLESGMYGLLENQDGYILLQKGLLSKTCPSSFTAQARGLPNAIPTALAADPGHGAPLPSVQPRYAPDRRLLRTPL